MLLNQSVKTPTTDREVLDNINQLVDPDSKAAIPNGFANAYVGLYFDEELEDYRVVYSKQAMVRALCNEDGMTPEEAIEYLSYNTWHTCPPDGNMPLYIEVV